MSRFDAFLDRIALDTYPEPITPGHAQITREMFERVLEFLPKAARVPRVLDVGCGQGRALELFEEQGFIATGISTNNEDVAVCKKRGFDVRKMDQNGIALVFTGGFDLIWARHVLEHSVAPYWTLTEFNRVCRPGGILYVEVPAPDTACHHETNKNHYSCLTWSTWSSLIPRAGWTILEGRKIGLHTQAGPDEYWSWICRKEKA